MDLTLKKGTEDLIWEDVLKIFSNKQDIMKSEKTELACNKIKTAFLNSYVVLSAWFGNEMVGFCRALSDGVRQSVIYDLNVKENHRNKGIGKTLMTNIVDNLPNGPIILYAIPGKEIYYQNLGFKKLLTGMALFPDVDNRKSLGFIGDEI